MRTREEVLRALEVIDKAGGAAFMTDDEESQATMAFAWGLILWVLKDPRGDSFQETMDACNTVDELRKRHGVN